MGALMSISSIGSQILSKLGSPDSRIPMAAKDIFNCAGYTYFSYDAGGKVEGKDRFVDEIGTGAIWLFGIPAYKKLIDKTVYKAAKISPDVDVRVVKDSKYLKKAIENAPDEKVINQLKKASENVSKTKGLALFKFLAALGLTMTSYFMLTKFKHNMTKKSIEKEFLENQVLSEDKNKYNNLMVKENPKFKDFNSKKSETPSFGSLSLAKTAEEFMFNPVKNMLLLDLGISTERLTGARTKGEFQEYGIKEGSFLFFVYFAGKIIKNGINKGAELLKLPISLDTKLIQSSLSKDMITKEKVQAEIKEFASKFKSMTNNDEIYEYIFKNGENAVVKAAKKSGIIETIKDSKGIEKIDTRKYIDLNKIEELINGIEKFIKNGVNAPDKKAYLNKIKGLKVASSLLNVAICCFALGYIVPKKMYELRKKNQNGNDDFHVKTEYEKELKEKQQQGTLNKK